LVKGYKANPIGYYLKFIQPFMPKDVNVGMDEDTTKLMFNIYMAKDDKTSYRL